jgi:hypothetical protein
MSRPTAETGVSRSSGESPVDSRLGERVCHGWQTLGFQAERDSEKARREAPWRTRKKAEAWSRALTPTSYI